MFKTNFIIDKKANSITCLGLASCGTFANNANVLAPTSGRENPPRNAWESDRPLPGMPTPQRNTDESQNAENENNNNNTHRSQQNAVPVLKVSPVFVGVTSFFVISTGVVCLVFYFGSKMSHRKDLLVAGMSLIVLGKVLRNIYVFHKENDNLRMQCVSFKLHLEIADFVVEKKI